MLDVAVPLGFAFQCVASKLGFRDKSQLKCRFLVDGSVLRTGRNHSKRVVWCKFVRCDGGDISWQAQYFVRVRRVDAERFVAGAGNREVVSRGECRCHIGIGV